MTHAASHTNHRVLFVGHGGLWQLRLPLVLTNIDDVFVRSHGMEHADCIIAEQQSSELVCLQWGPFKFDKT